MFPDGGPALEASWSQPNLKKAMTLAIGRIPLPNHECAMSAESIITVLIPGPLREYSGSVPEISLAAPTVRCALDELERSHPSLHRCVCDELGRVRRHINLFVNADHVRDRDDLDTCLKTGDVLSILPAVSGG